MANSVIEIQVTADIKQAAAGLDNLLSGINKLNGISDKAANSVQKNMNNVLGAFNGLNNANGGAGFVSLQQTAEASFSGIQSEILETGKTINSVAGNVTNLNNAFSSIKVPDMEVSGFNLNFAGVAEQAKAASNSLDQVLGNSLRSTNVEANSSVKSIARLQQQLKTFQGGLKAATNPESIARLNRAIDATNVRIKTLGNIKNPLKGVGSSATGAIQPLTDFGRIISDLPFGFIAIQNNLVPFTDSFARFVSQNKNAGAVLKGLAAGLLGPAGIGVGISIASGLWLKYGDSIQKALSGTTGLVDKSKLIKDVTAEATKSVSEQVVKLELFKSKLIDTNVTQAERIKIAKQYNSIADEQNQIDLTQINNLDLINSKIEKQNSLLLQRAISQAAIGKLSEAANKVIDNQIRLQEELSKRGFNTLAEYEEAQKKAAEASAKRFKENPALFTQAQLNNMEAARRGLDGVVVPGQKAAQAFNLDEASFQGLITTVKNGNKELEKVAKNLSGLITIPGLTDRDAPTPGKDQFNFFDKFFDVNPKTATDKAKQQIEMYSTALEFALQNHRKFVGLTEIIATPTKEEAIEKARHFWDLYQKGLVETKPNEIDVAPQIKFDIKPDFLRKQTIRLKRQI